MKVAIVQNQVTVDGRGQCFGEMVAALNGLGVVPDAFTFSGPQRLQQWEELLFPGRGLRYVLIRGPRVAPLRGYVYQAFLQNLLLSRRLRRYDVMVTGNGFLGFLPQVARRIHYVQFPVGLSLRLEARYRRGLWMLSALPLRLAIRVFEGRARTDLLLANSVFSRDRIQRYWPGARTIILHPPVDMPDSIPDGPRDIDVISLGGISPDKRQLEQIQIAAGLPQFRFLIMGAVWSPRYYEKLLKVLRTRRIANVEIIVDASRAQVADRLSRAKVFLHLREGEHFGIGVAQAIGHGCIPLVPDSGGQVEIVPDGGLRFRDVTQVPTMLRDILDHGAVTGARLSALQRHVQQFRPEVFRARFTDLFQRFVAA